MGWEFVKLGDLVHRKIGYGIVQPGASVDVGVPVIKVNNIISGLSNIELLEKTTTDIDARYARTRLVGGELVISLVGSVGKTAIVPKTFAGCNLVRATGLIDIKDEILAKWVKYYIDSPQGQAYINSNVNTTVQVTLNIKSLSDMPIPLPDHAIREKIVAILSSLDDKIELNRRINANLEQQAQAVYKSWFVDNKKDDWEEGVASDYYNITIGKTPPRKETKWFSTDKKDHVWISISDMGKHGMYLGQSSEYLTQSAIEKFSIVIVPDKTVLLSFKLTIGRVVISDGNVTTNEAIAHFNTNDQNLLEYTYLSLKNYEFAALGSTSSIAIAVNSKTIKSMRWIMPNRDLINQFHEKVGPLFNMIRQNEKEINYLSTLRDTLLPKLMSGEITV